MTRCGVVVSRHWLLMHLSTGQQHRLEAGLHFHLQCSKCTAEREHASTLVHHVRPVGVITLSASLKWNWASRVARVPVILISARARPTHDLGPSEKGIHRLGLRLSSTGSAAAGMFLPRSSQDSSESEPAIPGLLSGLASGGSAALGALDVAYT